MGKTNIEVVRDYLGAWHTEGALDPDRILANFTDDVTYHDIALQPHHGIERIARRVRAYAAFASASEIVILNIAQSDSGEVLTERRERTNINGKWLDMQLMSVARVRDGKISEWRDYWDAKTYERQMTELLGFPHKIEDLESI